jgi:hypothetical protein
VCVKVHVTWGSVGREFRRRAFRLPGQVRSRDIRVVATPCFGDSRLSMYVHLPFPARARALLSRARRCIDGSDCYPTCMMRYGTLGYPRWEGVFARPLIRAGGWLFSVLSTRCSGTWIRHAIRESRSPLMGREQTGGEWVESTDVTLIRRAQHSLYWRAGWKKRCVGGGGV